METTQSPEIIYCANHPSVETLLRCNKCEKPICMKCAVQTPVGFRCRECVRSQQAIYFNAESWDYPIAFVVSLIVTAIATPIASRLLGFAGFYGFIFAFMIGSGAGGILAQIIRWAVRRRRGRYLSWAAIAGIVVGFVLGNLGLLAFWGFGLSGLALLPTISLPGLIFAVLAAISTYQFLR